MFRICTARYPNDAELAELIDLKHAYLAEYQADIESAKRVVTVGVDKPDDTNLAEVAAWTMVANLILNLDEVVNKN